MNSSNPQDARAKSCLLSSVFRSAGVLFAFELVEWGPSAKSDLRSIVRDGKDPRQKKQKKG